MKSPLVYAFLIRLLLLVVSIISPEIIQARQMQLECMRQIGISEGLSNGNVTSILRDRNGFLWIGTRHGLNLCDRNGVRNFYYAPGDSNSLPGNMITTINEDEDGGIWIGTDGGLVRYDPVMSTFKVVSNDYIRASRKLGSFLVFGGNRCVFILNMATGDFSSCSVCPDEPSDDEKQGFVVKNMCVRSDSSLILAGTNGRLYLFDLSEKKSVRYGDIRIPLLYDMIETSDGQFFISSFKHGLLGYDESGQMTGHWTRENSGLSSDNITGFLESDGFLFCATDGGGISVMDIRTGKFVETYLMNGNPLSLPTNSLTMLYRDCLGSIWAGTVRNGIISLSDVPIHSYRQATSDSEGYSWGMSECCVSSLYADDDGLLWIGTDGGGINVYDPEAYKFRHLRKFEGKCVYSVIGKDEETLLVSVYDEGVYEYSKRTGDVRRFVIVDPERDREEQMSGVIPVLHNAADDKIMIFGQGLTVYDKVDGTFHDISSTADGGRLPFGPVPVYSDPDYSYFVAQVDSVVYRIDHRSDEVVKFVSFSFRENISSFCKGRDGIYYIGTRRGLYSCSYSGVPHRINSFPSVSYLKTDSDGNLWVISENRLYLMKDDKVIEWTEADGFVPNDVRCSFDCFVKGRCLYLGGTNGLCRIDYPKLTADSELPILSLFSMEVDGTKIRVGQDMDEIKVRFNSQLNLEIVTNEKDLFRNSRFKYSISHNGEKQSVPGDTRLMMSMLSEGKYSICASCLCKNGEWTPEYHLADIIVSPPWYRSAVAKTGVFLALISAFFLMIRILKQKEKRRTMEREIEYEQRQQKRQIWNLVSMCHELKTPLSLMYMPLKRLVNERDAKYGKSIETIFHQTCHINDVVNMILNYGKMKTGTYSLALNVFDFNDWLKMQISTFVREFEEDGIRLDLTLPESSCQVRFDERITGIVLSSLLSYILKHSPSGSALAVSSSVTDYRLCVSLSNRNMKLSVSERENLFVGSESLLSDKQNNNMSLSFCRELLEIHQGGIGFSPGPEGGATFTVSIPYIQGVCPGSDDGSGNTVAARTDVSEEQAEFCSRYAVLIIDDNQEFVNTLRNGILFCFKSVYTAFDVEKGYLVAVEKKPDVLIVNHSPQFSKGLELCERIRNNDEINNATIVLTAENLSEELSSEGFRCGVDQVIQKPFDEDTLISFIYNNLKVKDRLRQQYGENSGMISRKEKGFTLSDEQFVLALNKLILNNFTNPDFSIDFLMRSVHLGRTSFFTRVRNVTGLSINDYINKMRITKAMNLLTSTSLSVSEIADKVGCASQSYFSTLFKKYTGTTPREYKSRQVE